MAKLFIKKAGRLNEVESAPMTDDTEKDFERMLLLAPDILGERLLIIGEQEEFPELGGDSIDLLALDEEGSTVIIELKRGITPSGVDFQALKYAAYVSKLTSEQLGERAYEFFSRKDNEAIAQTLVEKYGVEIPESSSEFDLAQLASKYFAKYEPDAYEGTLNSQQRILIVAEKFDRRIALVIDWLARQGIDARALEYHQYTVANEVFFVMNQIIPVPDLIGQLESVIGTASKKEWLKDGRSYHLQKNAGDSARQSLLRMTEFFEAEQSVEVRWQQKLYVKIMAQAKEVRVYTGTSKKRLDIVLMHAPASELDGILYGTGIERGKGKDDSDGYWYETNSPWFSVINVQQLTDTTLDRIKNWLLSS